MVNLTENTDRAKLRIKLSSKGVTRLACTFGGQVDAMGTK